MKRREPRASHGDVARSEPEANGDPRTRPRPTPAPDAPPVGIVVTVLRGGCEVAAGDRLVELRLVGRHARREIALAVGDEVTFDPDRGMVVDLLPRRTRLVRRRPRDDSRREHVLAANVDHVGIVASVVEPPLRYGLVDRLLVAAFSGGLDTILIVNKIDLLGGRPLPEEALGFEIVMPVIGVSAKTREGIERLRARMRDSRTVLVGHSGVGKSSLLNALEPELRLETADLRRKDRRGRHVTSRSTLVRLAGGGVVIDTPGLREIEPATLDPGLLDRVYPDVVRMAQGCRFRDCRHGREPDCEVRGAVARGELPAVRYAGFRKLIAKMPGLLSA